MARQAPATAVDRFLQRTLEPDEYQRIRVFETCVVALNGDKARFYFAVVGIP